MPRQVPATSTSPLNERFKPLPIHASVRGRQLGGRFQRHGAWRLAERAGWRQARCPGRPVSFGRRSSTGPVDDEGVEETTPLMSDLRKRGAGLDRMDDHQAP